MNGLFISYRRSDVPDAVARLHTSLTARLRNREVFYDHVSLDLGDVFPDVLRERVTTAVVVLVVIGPNWVTELKKRAVDTSKIDFVREEVRLALAAGHTVIPVLVGGAGMPSEADFADTPELLPLLGRNAQSVRHDPDFDTDADRLIAYLERTGPIDVVGLILGGKYKVLRLVDTGGMGEVYEAAQTDMKRTVAVKLIKAGMGSKEVLARFDAERQALAVMDHPNVCKVLDAGTAPNGRPFFVMEFVRGVPVTQFCDDRKLPPKERLALFTDVCKAVQHAHQKGIIHRDIKPGNVLVEVIDSQPVPKVIDFGLAKALGRKLSDQSMAATEYGKWVGTLEYSSPEQAEGRFDIDTLTDVYSLGVLLHELLVGSPPFTREELLARSEDAAKEMIRTSEPAVPSVKLSSSKNLPVVAANRTLDPKALAKTVRGDLDWIILKSLSKQKNDRYATPTALADDIDRHLADQPISAGKPSAWVRLRKFYRRNRPQVIAGGLIAAALVAGIVGTTLGLLESERQRGLAVQAEQREKDRADGEERAKLAEREAKEAESKARGEEAKAKDTALRQFANSQVALAKQDFDEKVTELALFAQSQKNTDIARQRLHDIAPKYRFWEWNHLANQFEGGAFTLYGHRADVHSVACSPDGEQVYSCDEAGELRCWDARDGHLRWTERTGKDATTLKLSPDGQLLAVTGNSTSSVALYSPTGKRLRTLENPKPKKVDAVFGLDFAPDSRRLLVTWRHGWQESPSTVVYDAHTARPENENLKWTAPKNSTLPQSDARWLPDGRLVVWQSKNQMSVWDPATGKQVVELKDDNPTLDRTPFAISPDGLRVAQVGSLFVQSWGVATGKSLFWLRAPLTNPLSLAYSPDGARMAIGYEDGVVKVIDAWTGAQVTELRGANGKVRAVAFSPDNRFLYAGGWGGAVKVWDLRNPSGCHATPTFWSAGHLALSPRGDQAYVGGRDVLKFARVEARSLRTGLKQWEYENPAWVVDRLEAGEGRVAVLAIRPDPKTEAGKPPPPNSPECTVFLLDAATGRSVAQLPVFPTRPSAIALSADGGTLAVAEPDGRVRLWDARDGKRGKTLGGQVGPVAGLAFHPRGELLAISRYDALTLWDVAADRPRHSAVMSDHGPRLLKFSADGRRLASADKDCKVWATDGLTELAHLSGFEYFAGSLTLSPDGERVAMSSTSTEIKLWDSVTGQQVFGLKGSDPADPFYGVTFTPDGSRIVALNANAIKDGELTVWAARPDQHGSSAWTVAYPHPDGAGFSPDGSRLAVWSGNYSYSVDVWVFDRATGRQLSHVVQPNKANLVPEVTFSADSRLIRVKSGDDRQVFEADTRKPVDTAAGEWVVPKPVLADGTFLLRLNGSVRLMPPEPPAFPDEWRLATATDGDARWHRDQVNQAATKNYLKPAALHHLDWLAARDRDSRSAYYRTRLETLIPNMPMYAHPNWTVLGRGYLHDPHSTAQQKEIMIVRIGKTPEPERRAIDWRTLGGLLVQTGKPREAAAAALKAKELNGTDDGPPVCDLILAIASHELGEAENGRKHWGEVERWYARHILPNQTASLVGRAASSPWGVLSPQLPSDLFDPRLRSHDWESWVEADALFSRAESLYRRATAR